MDINLTLLLQIQNDLFFALHLLLKSFHILHGQQNIVQFSLRYE